MSGADKSKSRNRRAGIPSNAFRNGTRLPGMFGKYENRIWKLLKVRFSFRSRNPIPYPWYKGPRSKDRSGKLTKPTLANEINATRKPIRLRRENRMFS